MKPTTKIKPYHYIPTVGIAIFSILYYYSSLHYPGGSQASVDTAGFDWMHNYFCDLMDDTALNGADNPAFPISMAATLILTFSLAVFSYYFPVFIPSNRFWNRATRISGMASMFLAIWIFTDFHDVAVIAGSIFGLIAVIGFMKGISKNKLNRHLWMAILCFVLIVLNNVLYYGNMLYGVPLLQKISFAVILLWIVGLNLEFGQNKDGESLSEVNFG